MSDVVIIGIISFLGTVVGTYGGIMTANKLSNYRIEQLEKKVDKHNTVIERVYHIEGELDKYDEKFKVANHRIEDCENELKEKTA